MHNLARDIWRRSSKFQSLLVLLLMVAAMAALSDRFFTAANGWNIMRQISVNLCLSIGMTMVILAGGIDLSVGSILCWLVLSRRGSSNTHGPFRGWAWNWSLRFTVPFWLDCSSVCSWDGSTGK